MADFHGPARVLAAMPPEIISSIFECLIPQPPEIGETKPVSYNQMIADEPWFNFTRCHRGLRSLCLVSRRLSQTAFPLLYRTVAVWDEKSMLLFFRTLCNNPSYGTWTRYFSCHLTLTSNAVIREFRDLIPRYLTTFSAAEGVEPMVMATGRLLVLLHGSVRDLVAGRGGERLPQIFLTFILAYLSKVETVLIQVPVSDDQEEYQVLCEQIAGISHYDAMAPESESSPRPFHSIRTLAIQGDPELLAEFEKEDCECEHDHSDVWGAQPRKYASLFASLPNLTTLEVSSDDGVWSMMPDDETWPLMPDGTNPDPFNFDKPFLPNLRHVFLHDSIAYPGDLHYLLLQAPKLETLYMAPRGDYALKASVDDNGLAEHPDSLNNGLINHGKNLRTLDVSWEDISGFVSLVGPDGRLNALPQLPSLRSLCIQLAMLYGTPQAVLETPLVDLLPPNLTELTLIDWWWHHVELIDTIPDWKVEDKVRYYQSQHHYRVQALRTLTEFAREVVARLPQLKKVVFLVQIPWTWILEGAVPLEFHFEVLKGVFQEEGIAFFVESDELADAVCLQFSLARSSIHPV
ncbi:hypothetical protein B0J18DRAFT_444368 [Chaetomium sp. MPI-SDFR-AT-0129]|nr:hypothetical protein B0J18DRAFT_444368 [Chaetomium sp. MPI-SDFR-AT-0129]